MSEQMTFADGKYTVINDNGKLTALRHGAPWARDLTGDNLVYWMLVKALQQAAEIERLQREVVNRNQRALDGDKVVHRVGELVDENVLLRTELDALRLDTGTGASSQAAQPVGDLPGMWDESDFLGGATDCGQAVAK